MGLDIQPHVIRLMQLRQSGKRFQALQMAALRLQEQVFVEGKIRDFEPIRWLLNEEVKKRKLAGIATAIQIPANLVRLQTIQIPSGLSRDAIKEEIKLQLEKDFPGLSDSLAIDFSIERAEMAGYSSVHFVVTREEYISQYVSCINATGLIVKIVDVDIYALKRLSTHHPFSRITFSRQLLQQMEFANLTDFQMAGSLAMREVPKW